VHAILRGILYEERRFFMMIMISAVILINHNDLRMRRQAHQRSLT